MEARQEKSRKRWTLWSRFPSGRPASRETPRNSRRVSALFLFNNGPQKIGIAKFLSRILNSKYWILMNILWIFDECVAKFWWAHCELWWLHGEFCVVFRWVKPFTSFSSPPPPLSTYTGKSNTTTFTNFRRVWNRQQHWLSRLLTISPRSTSVVRITHVFIPIIRFLLL